MLTVYDIANYLLARQRPNQPAITNKKLQKLVYLAYGQMLALLHRHLWDTDDFRERVTAYEQGPVVPELRRRYAKYRSSVLPVPTDLDESIYDAPTRAVLDNVIQVYGPLSANELGGITHFHTPWIKAWQKVKDKTAAEKHYTDDIMDDSEIAAYFRKELSGPGGDLRSRTNAEIADSLRAQPNRDEERAIARAQLDAGQGRPASQLRRSLGI